MALTAVAICLATFASSMVLGYLWYRFRMGQPATKQILTPQMAVMLKTSKGMYRTRVAGQVGRRIRFESPISRQSFVPIRIGDLVTVEAASHDGIYLFRSKVIDRIESTHELIVEQPPSVSRVDRREERRICCQDRNVLVSVDGISAQLINVSSKGAMLRSRVHFSKGERITIELPWLEMEVAGWVIDSNQVGIGKDAASNLRIIFEEPVHLPRKFVHEWKCN